MDLTWERFRDYAGAGRFRWIAVVGRVVLVRSGATQSGAKLQRTELPSEDAARAHAAELAAQALKSGFERDGTRAGWLTDDEVAGRKPKPPDLTGARQAFRAALDADGIASDRTFFAQAALAADANALAARCLRAAERAFEVVFARAEQVADREHGGHVARPLPDDDLAGFYVSPDRVARLAADKRAGKLRDTDGPALSARR